MSEKVSGDSLSSTADHCSLSGSGSTHPVTNWTNIFSLSNASIVGEIVKRRQFPPRILPTFLHELTHHWCFHSPVGTTLALVHLRAQRNAVLAAVGESSSRDDAEWDCAHDGIRYRTIDRLLRPFSEGLALFAEFDAFPGESSVTSDVLQPAFLWLSGVEMLSKVDTADKAEETLKTLLIKERIKPEYEKRKVNLLSQLCRYSDDGDSLGVTGGYLLGYLAVKSLLMTLLSRGCYGLLDTDLYLIFIRSFVLEDFGFVEVILRSIHNEETYINDVLTYFQNRINHLVSTVSPSLIDTFEGWIVAKSGDPSTAADYPFVGDFNLNEIGRLEFKKLCDELSPKPDEPELVSRVRRGAGWTIAQRHLACVASFDSHITIVGRHASVEHSSPELVAAGAPALFIPLLPNVNASGGQGRVECFISPLKKWTVVTISMSGQLISAFFLGDVPAPERQDFLGYSFDARSRSKFHEDAEELLNSIMEKLGMDTLLSHFQHGCTKVAHDVYMRLATIFVEEDRLDEVQRKLEQGGIFAILGNEFGTLESLAALSIGASLNPDKRVLAMHLKGRGYDLREVLRDLELCAAKSGIPLVRDFDEIVMSFV